MRAEGFEGWVQVFDFKPESYTYYTWLHAAQNERHAHAPTSVLYDVCSFIAHENSLQLYNGALN